VTVDVPEVGSELRPCAPPHVDDPAVLEGADRLADGRRGRCSDGIMVAPQIRRRWDRLEVALVTLSTRGRSTRPAPGSPGPEAIPRATSSRRRRRFHRRSGSPAGRGSFPSRDQDVAHERCSPRLSSPGRRARQGRTTVDVVWACNGDGPVLAILIFYGRRGVWCASSRNQTLYGAFAYV